MSADWLYGAWFIIGLVVAGYSLAHQDTTNVPKEDLAFVALAFILIIATTWPIVIGFYIARRMRKT